MNNTESVSDTIISVNLFISFVQHQREGVRHLISVRLLSSPLRRPTANSAEAGAPTKNVRCQE